MDRLKAVYGEKSYPAERIKRLWISMQYLDDREFETIVSELIGTCATAPMLGKFLDEAESYCRKHAAEREKALQAWIYSQPFCTLCGKSGVVLAARMEDDGLVSFRCPCPIGTRKNFSGILWREEFSNSHRAERFQYPESDSKPRYESVRSLASESLKAMEKE